MDTKVGYSAQLDDGGSQTLTTTVNGGTAPFTYLYEQAGSNNGVVVDIIVSGSTTSTTSYTQNGGIGMIRVKVTDANGFVTYGYAFLYSGGA